VLPRVSVTVLHQLETVRWHLKLVLNGSMGDQPFPAKYTTAQNMLNTTTTNLFQQYVAAQNAGNSLTSQNTGLQANVLSLKSKLANIKKSGDTYDREFLDRSAKPAGQGIFRKRGITTLQDWLLFLFFLSYAIISLSILIFTVMVSREKLYAGLMVFIVTSVLGVMMSAVIMRFV